MDELIREMITPARHSSLDTGRRSRLTATAITVGLAAIGVTSLTTGALFTDTDTVSSSDFTTGTVDINPAMSSTHTLGATNMAPGDVQFGTVPVDNAGSLELRYSISVQATNLDTPDLAGQFDLAVYAGVPEASCNAAGVAALTPIASIAGVPTTLTPLVGNPATGANPGDRVLASGAGESLCVSVGLPLSTDDTFQNTRASVALTFDAEQTANN
jgi:spore coat-associated protein N